MLRPQTGPQRSFHASSADILIYGGAAGGGKSWSLIVEPTRHVQNRGFSGIIFRKTLTAVSGQGGLWDKCRAIYPLLGGVGRQDNRQWQFPSGARIGFGHLDDPNDVDKWQGSEAAYIGFDELCQFRESDFWYMLSRNRSVCGVQPYVRGTCNPDPDSFVARLVDWWIDSEPESAHYGYAIPARSGVIRWFARLGDELRWGDSAEELHAKLGPEPDVQPLSFTFIAASVRDNPILLKRDPAYLSRLMALPYVERMRQLKGNWKICATAGNRFRSEWFEIVDALPAGLTEVRYWDRAATEPSPGSPDPDWTAGVRMGMTQQGVFYVRDVCRFQGTPLRVRETIRNVASQDGPSVRLIGLEQDPAQAGKTEVGDLIRHLRGFPVRAILAVKDKVTRSAPLAAQAEQGNVKLLRAAWNRAYLDELVNFPEGKHDDQVDASSGAFTLLTNIPPEPNIY